jgi:GH24 family phage-related lysozyme (muramidase)
MPKLQYKQPTGALHIGGGRFFYANEPMEVPEEEVDQLLETYEDLEEVEEEETKHTKTSLKKLGAEGQKDLIIEMGGDLEGTNNEDDRIALILELQDKAGE